MALLTCPLFARAGELDEMSLERWAKLREAERYQLNIAEKYYREKNWKVALSEYEKFLTLYEKSEGSGYAQLKWSICQTHLRKLDTAVRDGFQSVIDYWPESPEATAASLLIGRAYKDMGELKAAKKAYAKVLSTHPKHIVAVMARVDLAAIARSEDDTERRIAVLRELTFETERLGDAIKLCTDASRELAVLYFNAGSFDDGLRALSSSYKDDELLGVLADRGPNGLTSVIRGLTSGATDQIKAAGNKLADDAIRRLHEKMPDSTEAVGKARARRTWLLIADIQGRAGRTDAQLETYRQMLKAFGTDDELLGVLASWHRKKKQFDEALRLYGQYKDPAAGRALAAACLREAGKPDEALSAYQELLTADAAHAGEYHWQIAATYQQFGRWKDAISAYRGTERFPETYKQMAACHRALKQYDEAIVLYRQVQAGSADQASWALMEVGRTQEEAGQKEPAIKTFQQVCDRYPRSGEAAVAHTHLKTKYNISVTLGGAKEE